MTESDPLQILLLHDRWATKQMLDACGRLSVEQFHRRFDIGPGSLHDTLTHMIIVIRIWTERLSGHAQRTPYDPDGQRRTAEQLDLMLEDAWRELCAEARRCPLDEMVLRTRDGKTLQFTRGAILVHVTTHGMHHRAQCLNMLRQSGVAPLPPSSVAEWTMTASP